MESWHSQKLNKYAPLAKVIEDNSSTVDLFTIEVVARRYSSRSSPIYLKRLGFNNKNVQKTAKSLSCISMKASFYIWLARNSSGNIQNSNISSNKSLITLRMQTFQQLAAKTLIPPETAKAPTQLL